MHFALPGHPPRPTTAISISLVREDQDVLVMADGYIVIRFKHEGTLRRAGYLSERLGFDLDANGAVREVS